MSEAGLLAGEKTISFKVTVYTGIDQFLEYFTKNWQKGNWTIALYYLFRRFFMHWYNVCVFPYFWENPAFLSNFRKSGSRE